jgi:hypothetical protein
MDEAEDVTADAEVIAGGDGRDGGLLDRCTWWSSAAATSAIT